MKRGHVINALKQYRKERGYGRALIKGNQADIKLLEEYKLNTLKIVDEENFEDKELTEPELFELCVILSNEKTIPQSASYTVINNLKEIFGQRELSIASSLKNRNLLTRKWFNAFIFKYQGQPILDLMHRLIKLLAETNYRYLARLVNALEVYVDLIPDNLDRLDVLLGYANYLVRKSEFKHFTLLLRKEVNGPNFILALNFFRKQHHFDIEEFEIEALIANSKFAWFKMLFSSVENASIRLAPHSLSRLLSHAKRLAEIFTKTHVDENVQSLTFKSLFDEDDHDHKWVFIQNEIIAALDRIDRLSMNERLLKPQVFLLMSKYPDSAENIVKILIQLEQSELNSLEFIDQINKFLESTPRSRRFNLFGCSDDYRSSPLQTFIDSCNFTKPLTTWRHIR